MKKLIILSIIISASFFAGCGNNAADNQEQQDSIAAERAADSMLQDAATDTLEPNGTAFDTSATDTLKLQNK